MAKTDRKYAPTKVNKVINIKPGNLFIADIIGKGIYEMVESGINHIGNMYAIVRLKKYYMLGFRDMGHETTCHPIDPKIWNEFKIIKS